MGKERETAMIQIYMDGGAREAPGTEKNFDLSWGIVALYEDFHVESSGAAMGAPRRFGGLHEEMALAQAARMARFLGFSPERTSFFTDDLNACHAGVWLHPQNYRQTQAEATRERYKTLCDQFYDRELYDWIMECLTVSRFTKIKGHSRVVYNSRADYLASVAREPGARSEPYDDWLHAGLSESSGPDSISPWQPPFTSPSLGAAGRMEAMFRLALRASKDLPEASPLRPIDGGKAPREGSGSARGSRIKGRLFGARARG